MRLPLLAAALVAAVPALAQTAPADSVLTAPSGRPAAYAERTLGLGFTSDAGPFAVGRYSTGVRAGHGVGVGVQLVAGDLPYDGLSTFVGAGPEVRLDRPLGGGALLELRAAGLARFGSTLSERPGDAATGAFGLRSLSTTTSATVRRPFRLSGGVEIVPRVGLHATVARQIGDVGTGGAFQSGPAASVAALAGADLRFRAFKRWWTIPVVAPIPIVGRGPSAFGF